MKALVTGGHDGFGASLCALLGEGSVGVSRRTGHNIGKSEHREKIAALSLGFDLFVNFAHSDFMQTKLLYRVASAWSEAGKSGHIFNIGSFSTYQIPDKCQKWVVSKYSLDVANKQFCRLIDNGELPFRMTLLRLGFLDTEKSRSKPYWTGRGHKPEDVAAIIKQVCAMSSVANIHEVTSHCPFSRDWRHPPSNGTVISWPL